MAKGSGFEREIAVKLSLWWTQDLPEPRDDVFWRSDTSGARATSRAKKGKRTANSYGDICAIDPVGLPLLEAVVLECKRGYAKDTIADLLDCKAKSALQQYEKWFEKAEHDQKAAGSFSWLLITRRDQRDALVFMPRPLFKELWLGRVVAPPCAVFSLPLRGETGKHIKDITAMRLDDWLALVGPKHIKDLLNWWRRAILAETHVPSKDVEENQPCLADRKNSPISAPT